MDAAYQTLMGHLSDRSSWDTVTAAAHDFEQKMLYGVAASGAQEEALVKVKEAAGHYVDQLKDVPPEVKSRLYADIDRASVDNINSVLADISRTRFVHIVAIGGMAVDSQVRNLQEGRGSGASGAIVTQPTRALIGEAGPEAVIPLDRMPGASALPSGIGGGGMTVVQNIYSRAWPTDRERAELAARARRRGFR